MLFNSIEFAVFLPIVFGLYWFLLGKKLKFQNLLIVISSYIFYGWWDWKFLVLILFSSVVDYIIGRKLGAEKNSKKRKLLLWLSIGVNLGILGIFKYFNFFVENFVDAFSLFGSKLEISTLKIILPVGISFYTFQTLSYTIDIYRRKLQPTKDFVVFCAFVSFFPQLVAGPIERATHLLPQFLTRRKFEYNKAVDGLRQILWGLFKKVVIADNCAVFANAIFENSADQSGSTLLLGAVFFAFQIYGDFSGYSDIAIGTARLFGFDLMQNFNFPYFSRDIAEFWRRWHISLSTWFRDYLYIPLGGSRGGKASQIRNVFIIFIVSGFWHGANWTFLFWGALNACYFLPLLLSNKNRNHLDTVAQGRFFPSLKETVSIAMTFLLTVLAWIFFRASSLADAFGYISGIFSKSLFSVPHLNDQKTALITIIFISVFILLEWIGREGKYAIERVGLKWKSPFRYAMYYFIVLSILCFSGKQEDFIYFQF